MTDNPLHKISYGMYIVSSVNGSKLNGQIANTLMQITNEPDTLAVSINKKNLTNDFIVASSLFSISVLGIETPLKFIGKFGFKSGREADKFKDTEYNLLDSGCPVVTENSVCFLGAKVINIMDCGTYNVFLGEVIETGTLSADEVMTYKYYHQVKCGETPKTAPTYIKGETSKNHCENTEKYRCSVCNYIYNPVMGDPDGGIPPGTPFENIPEDWVCPICGVGKDKFVKG